MHIKAMKNAPRPWHGLVPLMLFPWLVPLLSPDAWPGWATMWLLAVVIFFGCKWLTWHNTRVSGASLFRSLGYLLAWPGLDADRFLNPGHRLAVPCPSTAEWLFALGTCAGGRRLRWTDRVFSDPGARHACGAEPARASDRARKGGSERAGAGGSQRRHCCLLRSGCCFIRRSCAGLWSLFSGIWGRWSDRARVSQPADGRRLRPLRHSDGVGPRTTPT